MDELTEPERHGFLHMTMDVQKLSVDSTVARIRRDSWFLPAAEAKVSAWLDFIGETDPVNRQIVLDKCKNNPNAAQYFLNRSAEATPSKPVEPDLETLADCPTCAHLERSHENPNAEDWFTA